MTLTTLVSGANARQRETAIARAVAALPDTTSVAFILEGLADASSPLHAPTKNPQWRLVRVAPGCPCCIGNLVMRVTLNRLLRPPPAYLFISIANNDHRQAVRAFLINPPYDQYLILQDDLLLA